MTSTFIYPEVIEKIRTTCTKHVAGLASIDDFQQVIQYGEAAIIEEKRFCNFLTDVEGEIELIKYTVEEGDQLPESQRLAKKVLLRISAIDQK